jgi:hypothetical protein
MAAVVSHGPPFTCREHWRMVPRWLQRALWAAYRPGQERDKRPSAAYLAVQTRCRLELARAEGHLSAEALVGQTAAAIRTLLAEDAPDRALDHAATIEDFDRWLRGRLS